jgi:hypothetical protein
VIDHWNFSHSGSTVSLATAGSGVPGGANPQYMILPSSGKAGNGGSLSNSNFDPYIIGPATFVFADPVVVSGQLLTTANFSNVKIGFGTSPDVTLSATGSGSSGSPAVATPEPSTIALALSGLGTLGLMALRFRRSRPE